MELKFSINIGTNWICFGHWCIVGFFAVFPWCQVSFKASLTVTFQVYDSSYKHGKFHFTDISLIVGAIIIKTFEVWSIAILCTIGKLFSCWLMIL